VVPQILRKLRHTMRELRGAPRYLCENRTGVSSQSNRMSATTKIEWTDATWNPIRGCVKISPGCKHCYAETFAERFRNVSGHPYQDGFDPRLVPGKLLEPLQWANPRTVFVNSMSDLFQEAVPEGYIAAVATIMLRANWHTYQVLTKRAERMRDLLSTTLREAATAEHIWWGVSVEDQKHGVPRIGMLRRTPARIRFLSVEPLLEDLGKLDLHGIDWVIVGGESGHGARPMREEWVQAIKSQCDKQHTAFFFKQWGGVRKATFGRRLNGRTYDAMPPRTNTPAPDRSVRERLLQQSQTLTVRWLTMPLIHPRTIAPSPVLVR
jgi:protein gp37